MEALDKAIEEDNLPAYHQLRADILFNKGEFQQAFDEYMIVNNSDVASASSYYLAAKAKERVTGFNIGDVIDLLDKAIEKCGTNMNAECWNGSIGACALHNTRRLSLIMTSIIH